MLPGSQSVLVMYEGVQGGLGFVLLCSHGVGLFSCVLLPSADQSWVDPSKSLYRWRPQEQAQKLRSKGVIPSPGVCVFSQLDADKNRTLSKDELSSCIAKAPLAVRFCSHASKTLRRYSEALFKRYAVY